MELSTASSNVAQRVESRAELGAASRQVGDTFNKLLGAAMEMCSHTEVYTQYLFSNNMPIRIV